MVERMGIRELRDTLTTTMRRVRGGESIEITHHGRAVAMLTPVHDDRVGRLLAAGEVSPAVALDEPIRPLPATSGLSASDALEDDRAER